MPSQLVRAIRVLGTKYAVASTSNNTLATGINHLAQPKTGGSLPTRKLATAVSSLHGTIKISPAEALLQLARSIPTFPQTSPLALVGNWAWLKYLGVFGQRQSTSAAPQLCLSALSDDYTGRLRGILSEELGIGFGRAVARKWIENEFSGTAVSFADIDLALDRRIVAKMHQLGSYRPDYLVQFNDPRQSGHLSYAVLECKGTKDAKSVNSKLAHGLRQVTGIAIDKDVPPGLAVATVSNRREISVSAIDPLEYAVQLKTSEFEPMARVWTEQDPANTRLIVPRVGFLSRATAQSISNLARFAGLPQLATAWVRDADNEIPEQPSEVRSTQFGEFAGLMLNVEDMTSPTRVVTIFRGVATDVLHAIATGDLSAVIESQSSFALRRSSEQFRSQFDSANDDLSAAATLSDGSCLIVSADPERVMTPRQPIRFERPRYR